MLYGYLRPATPVFAVVGTGASFLTDVLLDNGQPSDATLIQWLSDATPTTGDYIDLQSTWSAELSPGLITVYGLSCPAGTRIVATGKRSGDSDFDYALGGLSTAQLTVEEPGGRIAWEVALPEGLDPLIGLQLRIYNDSSSVTWADPDTELSIGEADVWQTVELEGKPGWRDAGPDPSIRRRMLGAGLQIADRVPFRTFTAPIQWGTADKVYGGGLAHGEDWHTLRAKAYGNKRAVLVMDASSAMALHRTSIFGAPAFSEISHRDGTVKVYDGSIVIEEVR